MVAPESPVRFDHDGHPVTLHVQDNCSISRFVAANSTFYEAPFLRLLEAVLPSDGVVVDVGAHIGNHAVYFGAVLGHPVLALEPNPHSRAVLERNVEANDLADRVVVSGVAAGPGDGSGTLLPQAADDAGTMSLVHGDDRNGLEVRVRTLDEVYAEAAPVGGGDAVVLVKIDVEGYELEVLRGARQLLEEHRPLVTTELQSVADVATLREELEPLGYRAVGVANPTPTVIWWPQGSRTLLAPPEELGWTTIEYAVGAALRSNEQAQALSRLRRHGVRAPVAAAPESSHVLIVGAEDDDELARRLAADLGRVSMLRIHGEDGAPRASWSSHGGAASQPDRALELAGRTDAEIEVQVLAEVAATPPTLVLFIYDWDLLSVARRLGGLAEAPHVILFRSERVRTSWPSWPFINGARLRLLGPEVDAEAWRSRLIMDATALASDQPGELVQHLRRAAHYHETPVHRPHARPKPRLRVLLVSYYMPPCTAVATQRLAYWHRALPALANERGLGVEVDVVTASESPQNDSRYHVVLDRELDHPTGAPATSVRRELEQVRLNHIGATWVPYVQRWLSVREPYDVVVLSGNPFYYFELAETFQQSGTKVVLDFRDPFAENPRFSYSTEQRETARRLEARYAGAADAIVSVNDTCLDLIAAPPTGDDQARISIPNGYDERVVDAVAADPTVRDDRATFVYAGSFYADRDPTGFVASLDPERHVLLHAGRSGFASDVLASAPAAQQLGLRSYREVIGILKAADAGLIFTSGDPFEQTTKVFDYIGADIEIVIVTAGEPRTGELHEVTRDLAGVHWLRNEPGEIAAFVAAYTPTPPHRDARQRYSRRGQAGRLLDLLVSVHAASEATT